MADKSQGPRLTWLGQLVVLIFIAACAVGAWKLFHKKPLTGDQPSTSSPVRSFLGGDDGPATEIGIAYGTEKQRWLQWATEQFAQTRDGKRIKINLIPKGSLEGAQEILTGNAQIHLWSRASAARE